MALSQATLVQRVRRILGDTPLQQNGSTANGSTVTWTVTDSSKFDVGAVIEFQDTGEQGLVKQINSGTSIDVWARSHNGSAAGTTHSTGTIFIDPAFSYVDIINVIERTIQSMWPKAWKQISDTITPDSTSQWFDLAADAIDLISVKQRYGPSNAYVASFGEKDSGLPVVFGTHLPTALVASGIGLRFPNGFAHSTNTVSVDYRAKLTTTVGGGNYSDLSEGLMAEAVVYGAAAKLVGFKEVPLVIAKDVSQGQTPLGPQQRLTTAQWLEERYRAALNDLYDELIRTIPPMHVWG